MFSLSSGWRTKIAPMDPIAANDPAVPPTDSSRAAGGDSGQGPGDSEPWQTGHELCFCSHGRMHPSWNTWPHGIFLA